MVFSSDTKFLGLRSKLSNNDIINDISEKWLFNKTNYDSSVGFICLPCHPLCTECDGPKEFHCTQCKYFKSGNKCVANCSTGDVLFYILNFFKKYYFLSCVREDSKCNITFRKKFKNMTPALIKILSIDIMFSLFLDVATPNDLICLKLVYCIENVRCFKNE